MAWNFNGVDGNNLEYTPAVGVYAGLDALVLSIWCRRNASAPQPWGRLLHKSDGSTGDDFALSIQGTPEFTNKYTFRITTDSGVVTYVSDYVSTLNVWENVLGIYDGSTMEIYVNGVLQGGGAPQSGIIVDTGYNIGIGGHVDATNRSQNCQLAETAIWNGVLGIDEILALASARSPDSVRSSSLIFYPDLIRSPNDRFGQTVVQNGSPVVFPHPGIIYPSPKFVCFQPAAASGTIIDDIPLYIQGPTLHFDSMNLFLKVWDFNSECHYIETVDNWNIDSSGSWNTYNLDPYIVIPSGNEPSIVAEIMISNSGNTSYSGGIRTLGSSIDRTIGIFQQDATDWGNGTDHGVTMHVQLSADHQIECYAQNSNAINFTLLGYWVGPRYVETSGWFDMSATGWNQQALSGYNVPSDVAAELLGGTWFDDGRWMGVRSVGSSQDRTFWTNRGSRFTLEYRGFWSMFVNTSGASATIEVKGQSPTGQDGGTKWQKFFVAGYWSDPPGDYIEKTGYGDATLSVSDAWQSMTGSAPSDTIAHYYVGSLRIYEQLIGIRQSGSVLDRYLNLPRKSNGFSNYSTHVNVNSNIEGYAQYGAGAYEAFDLLGYWENLNNWPSNSGQIFMYISGITALAETNDFFINGHDNQNASGNLYTFGVYYHKTDAEFSANYPSGLLCYTSGSGIIPESGQHNLVIEGVYVDQASGDLFIDAHGGVTNDKSLFVYGYDFFSTSGDYPSGVPLNIGYGHEILDGSGNLFIFGPTPDSGNISMYIGAGVFRPPIDLFIHGYTSRGGAVSGFIKGPEFICSSGNFPYPLDSTLFTYPSGGKSPDFYIKGPEFICSSGSFTYPHDIEDFTYPYGDLSPPLSIQVHDSTSGTCSLYIGPVPLLENWTLYLKTEDNSINNSVNLSIYGFEPSVSGANQSFDNILLYLEAADADYPYTAGGTETWTIFLRAQSGNLTNDDTWTMFLKADSTMQATCNLYTYAHASGESPHGIETSGSINLICSVNPDDPTRIGFIPFDSDEDPWTLFLKGNPGYFNTADLYISGVAPIAYTASGNLFIEGLFEQATGVALLYLMGVSGTFNNGPGGLHLFLDAGVFVYNTSGNLYAHGY